MRPSLSRFVRLLPRSTISPRENNHPPLRIYEELSKASRIQPTLIEILLNEKKAAGPTYPPNLRIEPVVSKKTFAGVKRELVTTMKGILRER
ncbi:hypothetical protein F5148DRAFT_986090 [Russula earlei]|uniref:Uncharacterized protein n=1 Tax=Russula earlei TaxID=71964 RepID=A0ACC0TY05_9AGAM|nr:hypothetical protein F5148DRAFT_986090 [Russula earlei]